MNQEEIDKKFNEVYFKICMLDARVDSMADQFKVAYQQGVIDAQEYFIKKMSN